MSETKYPKLPKRFKEKWLEALRSGKYRSTKGTLCKLDVKGEKALGYCCLGVAAHLCGVPDNVLSSYGVIEASVIDTAKKTIPRILHGSTIDSSVVCNLVNMNDTGKAGFKRIADWIEKNL